MKKLEMVFATSVDTDLTVSFAYPKEDISRAEVETAAASLIPVLVASNGAAATALTEANIVTTTTEALE